MAETRMREILEWKVTSTVPDEEPIEETFDRISAARLYAMSLPEISTVTIAPVMVTIGGSRDA